MFTSSHNQSSRDTARRPITCQNPVSPGLTESSFGSREPYRSLSRLRYRTRNHPNDVASQQYQTACSSPSARTCAGIGRHGNFAGSLVSFVLCFRMPFRSLGTLRQNLVRVDPHGAKLQVVTIFAVRPHVRGCDRDTGHCRLNLISSAIMGISNKVTMLPPKPRVISKVRLRTCYSSVTDHRGRKIEAKSAYRHTA